MWCNCWIDDFVSALSLSDRQPSQIMLLLHEKQLPFTTKEKILSFFKKLSCSSSLRQEDQISETFKTFKDTELHVSDIKEKEIFAGISTRFPDAAEEHCDAQSNYCRPSCHSYFSRRLAEIEDDWRKMSNNSLLYISRLEQASHPARRRSSISLTPISRWVWPVPSQITTFCENGVLQQLSI